VLLDAGADGKELKRFRQEAKVLARLDHPNILKVVDMGTAFAGNGRDFPYIAMEYIEGSDLKNLLKKGYPLRKAAENLVIVAEALDYCHQMGITHRDLKPANVVIEEETGRPVIIDFGLVKRDARKMGLASIDKSRLSLTGEVKGTPQYMAPEQLDSESFGRESPLIDVYALGGILYHILAGRSPFEGAAAYNIMVKVLRDDPVDPREFDTQIPAGLAELALAALSKDPGDRPNSAGLFAEMLRDALREPSKHRLTKHRGKSKRRDRRHRRRMAGGIIVGGLLAAGLGGYGHYSNRKAKIEKHRLARIEASREAQEAERAEARRERARQERLEAKIGAARAEALETARLEAAQREEDRKRADPDWARKESITLYEQAFFSYIEQGRSEEALDFVNRSLALWEANPMARALRAKINSDAGHYTTALPDVERAISFYEQAIERAGLAADDPRLFRAKTLRTHI
jgi:tetratricopeptide (TPR) repeat protein